MMHMTNNMIMKNNAILTALVSFITCIYTCTIGLLVGLINSDDLHPDPNATLLLALIGGLIVVCLWIALASANNKES